MTRRYVSRLKTWQRLALLQILLSDLLGSRYYFGISDAPHLDLFLWFILCHRPDMAIIWWQVQL